MEGGNCFIYVFQIKLSERVFFCSLCFYFSKTCSCLNLGELGSEIQFWNRKFKLHMKPLWRPDSLINYSLKLTLSNLLKQSCSQSFQLESLLGWAEKRTISVPDLGRTSESGGLGYSAEFLLHLPLQKRCSQHDLACFGWYCWDGATLPCGVAICGEDV